MPGLPAKASDSTSALRTGTELPSPTGTSDETNEAENLSQQTSKRSPELPLAQPASSAPIAQTQSDVETSGQFKQQTVVGASIPSVMGQPESGGSEQQDLPMTSAEVLTNSPVLSSQPPDFPLAKAESSAQVMPSLPANKTSSEGNTEVVLPYLGTKDPVLPTAPKTSTLPLVKAQSVSLLVQRQPTGISTTSQPSTDETSNQPSNQVAISPEIPIKVSPPPQSTLVWRKTIPSPVNNGAKSSLPLTMSPAVQHSEHVIARQTTPDTISSTTPIASAETGNSIFPPAMPVTAQAPATAPEFNVVQIAEEVSRILFRKLTVERERRGMSR